MKVSPISCNECRRRKIKCNKRIEGCSQCVEKGRTCSFPKRFRSIAVDEVSDQLEDKYEHLDILKENELLRLNLKAVQETMKKRVENIEEEEDQELATKAADCYYGPNSSEFMMGESARLLEFDDFMKLKRQMKAKRALPLISFDESLNLDLMIQLVERFFQLKNYYNHFVSYDSLMSFLKSYSSIKMWNNDDDMLLLIAVLLSTLRYINQDDPLLALHEVSYHGCRSQLTKQFNYLKNGMSQGSLKSLQSYVLFIEDLFYNEQVEQAWSLMFLTVGSAYSLGLHVYEKDLGESLNISDNTQADINNDLQSHQPALKIIRESPRTSLWLTINFISTVLCSVLGRPNPVIFTFQILLRNYAVRLNYKIGLAELIKRSTSVLIESYRTHICYRTILDLDSELQDEVMIYEKILYDSKTSKEQSTCNFYHPAGSHTDTCRLESDCETLCDLILFYSNRAKFHQPFIAKHERSTTTALDSIIKVIHHSSSLVNYLKEHENTTSVETTYPFFSKFIYQAFVVFFTFLHLPFGILRNHVERIQFIRQVLNNYLELVGRKKRDMTRITECINDFCDKLLAQYHEWKKDNEDLPPPASREETVTPEDLINFVQDVGVDPYLGLDLSDPFFIQNPENFSLAFQSHDWGELQ